MIIKAIGINHKTAPIEIREQFCLTTTQQDLLISDLKDNPIITEAFVLSTCNRTEVYVHIIDTTFDSLDIINLIAKIKCIPINTSYSKYFYTHLDDSAIRHLFEVATGLDSLVLGEKQILGQVRDAFARAQQRNVFSKSFNILSNIILQTGKSAHSKTNIGFGGSSVSWAALAQAEKLFSTFSDKSALLIGAGQMSKLAVGQVSNKGFKKFYLMNRTIDHAKSLSEKFGGQIVSFCDMKEILGIVDLCICSASAPHFVLEHETVVKVMKMRKQRRIVFIDISMPRNIDPKIMQIPNVILWHIDDLQDIVNDNMEKRKNAVSIVNAMIDRKINIYYTKIEKLALSNYDLYKEHIG